MGLQNTGLADWRQQLGGYLPNRQEPLAAPGSSSATTAQPKPKPRNDTKKYIPQRLACNIRHVAYANTDEPLFTRRTRTTIY